MTGKKSSSLVPRLRFPEFDGEASWNEMLLSVTCDVNPTHDGLPESFIYIDLESVKDGALVERKKIKRDGAPSRAQRVLRRKDIIYQTVRPYQRNNLFFDIDDGYDYVASTGYAQLRAHACPAFFYQLLHTDSFVDRVLAKCTGSNYPAINSSDLADICVLLPTKPEQQKIANCLCTLDDLIAAEGRKLEALRRHKQGLMQQLFPQPGESLPRLRFPEFEDAPEWEQRALGNLGVFIRGLTYTADDVAEAGLLVLRSSNIQGGRLVLDSDLVHVGKECPPDLLLREGDVAICMSNGSKALVGKSAEYRGGIEGDITVGAFCSIFRASNTFAKLAFATEAYSDYVALGIAGGNINNLKNSDLEAFEFYVPRNREEQQKIADCLGSLDDLIAAAGRRLEALRRHKQGLMQQLFPIPEEETR